MYELDFCNMGVYFKMAKPSRMNRNFEIKYICERIILRYRPVSKAWCIYKYKTLQFSLEIGSLCLGVTHGSYNASHRTSN